MPATAFRLFFLLLLFSGCTLTRWGKNRRIAAEERALVESRRAPKPLGRIALVDAQQRFVLIELTMNPPTAGLTLRSYAGAAVSAELRATSVRRRPFLVADLVSGTPVKGELVVQPGVAEEAPKAQAAAPADTKPAPRRGWLGFFGRRN